MQVGRRQLARPFPNETEADPAAAFGGTYIGDYIQVVAVDGSAYVHFNANYRSQSLLGEGSPIPQEDNYLVKLGE